jgi:osmotically inducible lipoprotein OsmB
MMLRLLRPGTEFRANDPTPRRLPCSGKSLAKTARHFGLMLRATLWVGCRSSAKLHLDEVRMSQLVRSLAVLGALGLTAACGDNPTDRALTGGAAGAAGGAVVGSTVGHPVGGAVVGGLGGAAVGAATTPRRDYYY